MNMKKNIWHGATHFNMTEAVVILSLGLFLFPSMVDSGVHIDKPLSRAGAGWVVVDIRESNYISAEANGKIIGLLKDSGLPIELWVSSSFNISKYALFQKENVSVRIMPFSGIKAGHIGKAFALLHSDFDFPIVSDGDSRFCKGWVHSLTELLLKSNTYRTTKTKNDGDADPLEAVDVVWHLAPMAFGASRDQPTAHVSPLIASQLDEFKKFPERNTGTFFGVRRTNRAVQDFLSDAMKFYTLEEGQNILVRSYSDQLAFREAFFIHRARLNEVLVPSNTFCRPAPELLENCTCWCECSKCLVVHRIDALKSCIEHKYFEK